MKSLSLFVVISVTFLSIIISSVAEGGGKYSESQNLKSNSNTGTDSKDRIFRSQLVNFLWAKAEKRLERQEAKTLYVELTEIDHAYMSAKQLGIGGSGKDSEGEQQRDVEKRLRQVAERHGVLDILQTVEGGEKRKSHHGAEEWDDKEANRNRPPKQKIRFQDVKINKLWEAAQESGFSDEELRILQNELNEYQIKIDEYKEMLDSEFSENSIHDSLDANEENKKKLKAKNREINQGLEKVEESIASTIKFKTPRVRRLWENVANGSFSPDEIEELEEELRDFENKISKLEWIKEEVRRTERDKLKSGKEENHYPEHKTYQNKLKKHAHTVEKFEQYLESKIIHKEL